MSFGGELASGREEGEEGDRGSGEKKMNSGGERGSDGSWEARVLGGNRIFLARLSRIWNLVGRGGRWWGGMEMGWCKAGLGRENGEG